MVAVLRECFVERDGMKVLRKVLSLVTLFSIVAGFGYGVQKGTEKELEEVTAPGVPPLLEKAGEPDEKGNLPLHYVAVIGSEGLFREIAGETHRCGLINHQNNDGDTPLHIAIRVGKEFAVKELVELKADLLLQNKKGNTPLHEAVLSENRDNTALLLKELEQVPGFKRNLENNDGDTVLHLVARHDAKDMAKFLLSTEQFSLYGASTKTQKNTSAGCDRGA